jgi:hypothetical protein
MRRLFGGGPGSRVGMRVGSECREDGRRNWDCLVAEYLGIGWSVCCFRGVFLVHEALQLGTRSIR